MAPRKSTAAGEDDRCPRLKLIMEKGPLSGQDYDFGPGSMIHIGRLVRGNTLSIKDAGISSKHVLFQVDSGRHSWTVTDLESSNGTVLNGRQLEPFESAVISDGDVIKIGERTSIKVKFESNGVVNESSSGNVRRNTRRRVRNQVADLVVIDEDSELGLGNKEDGKKIDEVDKVEVKQGRNASTRRTRSLKKNESILKDLNEDQNKDLGVIDEDSELGLGNKEDREKIDKVEKVEVKQGRNASTRRTQSSKKNESVLKDLNVYQDKDLEAIDEDSKLELGKDEDKEKIDEVTEVETNRGRSVVGMRRTRSSAKNETLLKNLNLEGVRTRSSRKDEDVDEIGINLSVVKGKRTRKGGRGRKRLPVESVSEETEKEDPKMEQNTSEDDKMRSEVGANESVEGRNSGKEGARLASTSGVKESNADKGKMVADLEKMTLGEWFDFLEVYLPQQIIDETEKMISEMKQKAQRVHEFRLQQMNAKGKENVVME